MNLWSQNTGKDTRPRALARLFLGVTIAIVPVRAHADVTQLPAKIVETVRVCVKTASDKIAAANTIENLRLIRDQALLDLGRLSETHPRLKPLADALGAYDPSKLTAYVPGPIDPAHVPNEADLIARAWNSIDTRTPDPDLLGFIFDTEVVYLTRSNEWSPVGRWVAENPSEAQIRVKEFRERIVSLVNSQQGLTEVSYSKIVQEVFGNTAIGKYLEPQTLMTGLLSEGVCGGNCVANTKLIMGILAQIKKTIGIPAPFKLGVLSAADHVEPVFYNPDTREVISAITFNLIPPDPRFPNRTFAPIIDADYYAQAALLQSLGQKYIPLQKISLDNTGWTSETPSTNNYLPFKKPQRDLSSPRVVGNYERDRPDELGTYYIDPKDLPGGSKLPKMPNPPNGYQADIAPPTLTSEPAPVGESPQRKPKTKSFLPRPMSAGYNLFAIGRIIAVLAGLEVVAALEQRDFAVRIDENTKLKARVVGSKRTDINCDYKKAESLIPPVSIRLNIKPLYTTSVETLSQGAATRINSAFKESDQKSIPVFQQIYEMIQMTQEAALELYQDHFKILDDVIANCPSFKPTNKGQPPIDLKLIDGISDRKRTLIKILPKWLSTYRSLVSIFRKDALDLLSSQCKALRPDGPASYPLRNMQGQEDCDTVAKQQLREGQVPGYLAAEEKLKALGLTLEALVNEIGFQCPTGSLYESIVETDTYLPSKCEPNQAQKQLFQQGEGAAELTGADRLILISGFVGSNPNTASENLEKVVESTLHRYEFLFEPSNIALAGRNHWAFQALKALKDTQAAELGQQKQISKDSRLKSSKSFDADLQAVLIKAEKALELRETVDRDENDRLNQNRNQQIQKVTGVDPGSRKFTAEMLTQNNVPISSAPKAPPETVPTPKPPPPPLVHKSSGSNASLDGMIATFNLAKLARDNKALQATMGTANTGPDTLEMVQTLLLISKKINKSGPLKPPRKLELKLPPPRTSYDGDSEGHCLLDAVWDELTECEGCRLEPDKGGIKTWILSVQSPSAPKSNEEKQIEKESLISTLRVYCFMP